MCLRNDDCIGWFILSFSLSLLYFIRLVEDTGLKPKRKKTIYKKIRFGDSFVSSSVREWIWEAKERAICLCNGWHMRQHNIFFFYSFWFALSWSFVFFVLIMLRIRTIKKLISLWRECSSMLKKKRNWSKLPFKWLKMKLTSVDLYE